MTASTRAQNDTTARLELYGRIGEVERIATEAGGVLATIHPLQQPIGCLGAPAGDAAALQRGEAWLRERGCTTVWGPMEMCTWFSYRASLGPEEHAPFKFEPLADPAPWRAAGYREAARYLSWQVSNEEILARVPETSTGLHIRSLGDPEQDLRAIHELTHVAFEGSFGFVPLPLELFRAMYQPVLELVDPNLVLIAEHEGEPVAFLLALPDHAPDSGRFVIKSLAAHPRVRRAGVGRHLVLEAHRRARDMGLGAGIHALMRKDNPSKNIARGAGQLLREYVLFEKTLP